MHQSQKKNNERKIFKIKQFVLYLESPFFFFLLKVKLIIIVVFRI